jgi:hypothetical protein
MKGILHHHVETVDAVALHDDDLSVGFIVVELGVTLLLGNILTDGLLVGFGITLLTIGNNVGYDAGFMFGEGERRTINNIGYKIHRVRRNMHNWKPIRSMT